LQIDHRRLGLAIAAVFLCLTLILKVYTLAEGTAASAEITNLSLHTVCKFYPARRLLNLNVARKVTVYDGNESQEIITQAPDVKTVLQEMNLKLGSQDRVEPALSEEVTDTIKITRVELRQVTEEVALDYPVEKKEDQNLFKGEQRVLEKGKKGLARLIYEVVLENGQEVSRKQIEKVVLNDPKPQIVAFGTRQIATRGGENIEFDRVITMTATAYTHTGHKTYTGIWPSVGIVAVDPKVIPLGTRLYVDGYGYATAMDIGGAIKGNRIDLFFETREEALRWGRRSVKVFVLK